jgi:hypothetical protein
MWVSFGVAGPASSSRLGFSGDPSGPTGTGRAACRQEVGACLVSSDPETFRPVLKK